MAHESLKRVVTSWFTSIVAVCVLFSFAENATAQPPANGSREHTQSLERRIQELESALQRLENNQPITEKRFSAESAVLPTDYSVPGPSHAPAPTGEVEDRLLKVEDWINGHQTSLDEKKAAEAKNPTFKMGGRIHADYWGFANSSDGIGFFENPLPALPGYGQDPESRFQFRRIRLEAKGDIFGTMMWRTQIDFNNPSSAEIKDVWIGFKNLPCNHTLLIGNQKRPLGMDHLNSSRYAVFTERPLVVEAFNEDARRPGITFYGHSDDDAWGWATGAYLLSNITRVGRYIGDSSQASLNMRLWNSPVYENDGRDYFHWAVAVMLAKPDGDVFPGDTNFNEARFRTRAEARSTSRWLNTGRVAGAEWYEILAAEAVYNSGPLQIVSEYQFAWMQRDSNTVGTGPDLSFQGGYVHIAYFLTGEHMPYNRQRGTIARVTPNENFWLANWCHGCHGGGWGAWQIAARYSFLDLSSKDILGGVEHNLEVALNWHWTSHSRMQFGVIYGDIDNHRPVGGFTSGHFLMAGTRFAVEF